jgi:hypothetical protein
VRHYTAHARPQEGPDEVRFVKDGFSWPAFFFPLPWLIVKGQWLWLVLFLLALVIMGAIAKAGNLSGGLVALLSGALSLLMGLEANDIYRRSLIRRGFASLGPAAGANLEEAELSFFSSFHAGDNRYHSVPGKEDPLGAEDPSGFA